MSEQSQEPKYGNPEIDQPTFEQVDALVRGSFARYVDEGATKTPWLVRPSNDDGHPAMWRHFQIETFETGWQVKTAERSIIPNHGKNSWFETNGATFTYKNENLNVEHRRLMPGAPRLGDLIYMRPKDVFVNHKDDTPAEAAQLLYYYFTETPPVSKAEALVAYQIRMNAEPGETRGRFAAENRRIRTGTFIGRLLERTYMRIDPNFAKYDD